jgi:cobalt transporter subunit CbtA
VSIFRSIVFTAAAAGLLVGVAVTAAQQAGTVPLILKAEVYEKQAEAAGAGTPAGPAVPSASVPHTHDQGAAAGHGHEHATVAWGPADGFERNAYTALFNVVEWIGFGLCLAGVLVLSRRPVTWREGLMWGLGGFAAVVLAPGLGLPPELPGVPAADLVPRQVWWVGTALATAAGLVSIALGRSPLRAVLGAVLIAAPHVIGAPVLDHGDTTIPETLSRQFVSAVTVTTFLSWVLLGGLTGFFLRRFTSTAG